MTYYRQQWINVTLHAKRGLIQISRYGYFHGLGREMKKNYWNVSEISPTPWTRHEKSHGHREIFHAVKKVIVISRREIYISRREKGHGLCEIFHGVEKIYSLRFMWTSLSYRECCCIIKSRLPTEAHFSDLLQALKLESRYHSKSIQSVPKIRCWRLHRRLLLRFPAKKHATSVCFFCVYRTVFHLRKRNKVFASFIFAWRLWHFLLGMYSSIFKKMIAKRDSVMSQIRRILSCIN